MWHKNLERNMFISNLYTEIPQLVNVRIAQIKILDEGDKATIIFDMPNFPDKPPKKWANLGYNTAIVQLDFFEVEEIMIKSMNNRYRANIEIITDEIDTITVNVTGSVEAKIKARVGMIQSIEGYCNQP